MGNNTRRVAGAWGFGCRRQLSYDDDVMVELLIFHRAPPA
jgi:hypothetical protein